MKRVRGTSGWLPAYHDKSSGDDLTSLHGVVEDKHLISIVAQIPDGP